MSLINCPECKKEISDKADGCPHCGYPIAKLKPSKRPDKKKIIKKTIDLIDPRFPILPDELGIGKPLSLYTSKFNFEGTREFDYDYNDDFNTCRLKLSIHEKGLRIYEIINEKKSCSKPKILNLHFSVIISIKKANFLQSQQHKSAKRDDTPLDQMLFCNTTSYIEVYGLKYQKIRWENTSILVVNYWNTKLKCPTMLIIRGFDTQILKFVNTINKAKSNYEIAIPNIPDKKADSRYLWTLGIVSIITAGITLFILNHYFP